MDSYGKKSVRIRYQIRVYPCSKKGGTMKIGKRNVTIFRIRNRKGYAAVCDHHLTEGRSPQEAYDRMEKAIHRTYRIKKK